MKSSSEKRETSRFDSFSKRLPNYAKSSSTRKQKKGQPKSRETKDENEAESITSVFKKRRDRPLESEYSAINEDESDQISLDNKQINENDRPLHQMENERKLHCFTSVFEPRNVPVEDKYAAANAEESEHGDSDSDQVELIDRTIMNSISQMEASVCKSDGSINTGVTLRHSNMTTAMTTNSSLLDLSNRSSTPVSLFAEKSDMHFSDTNMAKEIKSNNSPSRTDEPDLGSNDQQRLTVNAFQWRSWIIIVLFSVSFLFSCYSSLGCNFLTLNIGFEPANMEWKQDVDFGPWSFSSSALSLSEDSATTKCLFYPSDFHTEFISPDIFWKVSRILPIISFILHCLALILILVMGIKSDLIPLSRRGFLLLHLYWKRLTTLVTMIILLLEGSKFIFLFNSLCKSKIWINIKTKMIAESCEPGTGSHLCILSMLFYFLICLILCNSPIDTQIRKRLEKDFNSRNGTNVIHDQNTDHLREENFLVNNE